MRSELYTGAIPVAGSSRVYSGRKSAPAPRTEQVQRLYTIPDFMRTAAETWANEHSGEAAGTAETTGCALKHAASVIFVRDGDDGLETILTYRPGCSPLGIVAFPGGMVTAEDAQNIPWCGADAEHWQRTFAFGDATIAHKVVVAAVRETFEETGLLLAGEDEGSVAEYTAGSDQMNHREAISDRDETLSKYLAMSGLKIRADLLRPVVRWQSPDFCHKRYDVAYFTTAVPVGQQASLLKDKGIWGDWVNVRELLAGRATSDLGDRINQPDTAGKTLDELVTPGVMCTLESLAKVGTSVAWLAKKRTVEVKKPILVKNDGQCMLSFTEVVKAAPRTGKFGAVAAPATSVLPTVTPS